MTTPSSLEVQMLGLINQERTSRGLDPLEFDLLLNASSEAHSQWMQTTGQFSHAGQGGTSATARMRDAGFEFSGSWASAENIAYQTERGASGYADDVVQLHNALMNSAGHRANILDPNLESIGIGIETGSGSLGRGNDSVIVTQNFARSAADNAPYYGAGTPVEIVPETVTPVALDPDLEAPGTGVPETVKPVALDEDVSAPSGNSPAPWEARLDRWQAKAEKFQTRADTWADRAEVDPINAALALAKAEAWGNRLEKVKGRIENWIDQKTAQWERNAARTEDTADDAQVAADLDRICDDIQTWKVNWGTDACDHA